MTHDRFLQNARKAKRCANLARDLFAELQQLASFHQSNGLSEVGSDPAPEWLTVDEASGNIQGADFTPAEYLNLLNFVAQLNTWVGGGTPAAGDYRSVINRVADA